MTSRDVGVSFDVGQLLDCECRGLKEFLICCFFVSVKNSQINGFLFSFLSFICPYFH